MDNTSLPIVIVGHVDHGKSTLIGRLLYDTGSLTPERLDDIKKASISSDGVPEFAFVMDHLEEERTRRVTIDIAHTYFKTPKRKYVIIDAPGHKEFLKNMITGSTQAEAALLLVDAAQGVRDQTRRHGHLLSLLGINRIVVLVNKMDLADYSLDLFEKVKGEVESFMKEICVPPLDILPISARLGDNVSVRSGRLRWFSGPTLLEALDRIRIVPREQNDLRFPVQDIYDVNGTRLAVGRVESGTLKAGLQVSVLPQGKRGRVKEIRKFPRKDIFKAPTGDCVGMAFEGPMLSRGDIVVTGTDPQVTELVRANIFWMGRSEYLLGGPVRWKCVTQEASGKISAIHKRFDPALIDVVEIDSDTISPAQIAEVTISLEKRVAVDMFADFPETGRFVLEQEGDPLAGGIVI